ncbi:immunity protein TriTu family protein [Serratia rubidaea]|uniref:immunity protein TriTu family protein n=1 Tax=Serratia rubidaea TaxID=61652 RepID=UPI00242A8E1D|nr:hypothetical protein [Serratia rubidaea]MCR0999461.1 hypothetical protein [Serratia rubidaea]
MLQDVKNWILSRGDYEVKINNNDFTDSLVVDFESENKIARFTVWDDKSCILEVMDVNTGQYIINDRRELSETNEVLDAFKEFSALLD